MSLLDPPRSFAAWGLAHGLPRRLILRQVRRGDPVALVSLDPATVADPFATYDVIRGMGPLVRNDLVAATAHHETANRVLRGEDFGAVGGHAELPAPMRWVLDRVMDPATLGPVDPPSMLVVDPPDHTRYRRLVSRAFTARKVGALRDRVESVATRLLDDLVGEESFDLVARYASLLPVAVIADLLGVPEEDHHLLLDLGNQAAITLDPALTFGEYRAAERALRGMHRWFDAHLDRLRRDPGDDLLSTLLQDEAVDQLTDVELHQVGLLVLGAGFETTVNLISNAVAVLDQHPEQLQKLRENPDGWPDAVEEVLRYDSPVQLTMRAARRDTEVGGEPVRRGEAVLVLLGGANRDPAVFDDPHTFDVTRPDADRHLSFSAGIHFCLGASLARLEAAAALRLLYERFPRLSVAGLGRRRHTRVLRGWKTLPVTAG